jgi:hypothetical protein
LSTIAKRPGRGGSDAAELRFGRVVEAVVVDAPSRVVVDEEFVVLDPLPRVVVVVEPPGSVVVGRRVVVEARAVAGLRS